MAEENLNVTGGAGPLPTTPKSRVRLLDLLRGFSVLSMVAYHGMYDLVYIYGVNAPWYSELPGHLWQQSICWVFILVSGASLHYGRNWLRRGALVLGCGLLLSAATALLDRSLFIAFGILHLLGVSMLLAALLQPLLKKIPPLAGFLGAFGLFVFTRGIYYSYFGLLECPLIWLPQSLYSTRWLFPLGLPGPAFYSSDYFPLVPWFFLFLAGYFGWGLVKHRAKASPPGRNPLEWVGRHSLLIYMAHQPVLMALFWLAGKEGLL